MAGPHLPALECVQLWSDIEEEVESLSGLALVLAGVKVDDILDLGTAAVNDPVVTVKGLRVSEHGVYAGSRGQGGRVTSEGDELGASASVLWSVMVDVQGQCCSHSVVTHEMSRGSIVVVTSVA